MFAPEAGRVLWHQCLFQACHRYCHRYLTKKYYYEEQAKQIKSNQLEFIFSLILEKCYGITSVFSRDIVHSLEDDKTGLVKYFQLNLDTRFIEITAPAAVAAIEEWRSYIPVHYDRKEILAMLQEKIPLDMFSIEGFGISSVTDVTPEYSIENIKDLILKHSSYDEEKYYSNVIHSLKTLVGK